MRLHVLDTEHPDRIAKWVSDRIKWCVGNDFPEGTPAIGVIGNKGQLLAGVVYHDYQEDYRTIQISMAADSPIWASKGNIRGLLHYPFRQLDCFKVWISTMHDKHHNIKTFEHVGFKREAVLAHQYGYKKHAWIGRMLQPEFAKLYEDT